MNDISLTLYNGDNFDFLDDNSVDFILTDPPFNISKKTNFHTYKKNTIHSYQFDKDSDEHWDTYTHDEFLEKLNEWAKSWSRVLRKGGSFAIFCADAYISHLMEVLTENGLSPRRLLVWRKNNAVPINRKYMMMSANEYIITGVKRGKSAVFNADVPITQQSIDNKIIEASIVADKVSTIAYTKIRENILSGLSDLPTDDEHITQVEQIIQDTIPELVAETSKRVKGMYKTGTDGQKYLQACVPNYIQHPLKVGNRIHPTEKPVPLLQYLVTIYSNSGDTVLDGFGGSGSSGEAALSLQRNAIIVERDAHFYTALTDRLSPMATTVKTISQ